MIRSLATLSICLVSVLFFSACREKEDYSDLTVPRLLIEPRGVDYGNMGGEVITLPLSRTRIAVNDEALVNEFDITNAELVKVDLGLALLLQVGGQGARDLYRASVTNKGSRVVLTINGNAIGARHLDGAIQDGKFYTFVEIPDEDLVQLVLDLKTSIEKLKVSMKP